MTTSCRSERWGQMTYFPALHESHDTECPRGWEVSPASVAFSVSVSAA